MWRTLNQPYSPKHAGLAFNQLVMSQTSMSMEPEPELFNDWVVHASLDLCAPRSLCPFCCPILPLEDYNELIVPSVDIKNFPAP